MNQSKILIVGAMYSLNYGDGVICKTVQRIVEDIGLKASIFGISGMEDFPNVVQVKNIQISIKRNIKRKIKKIFPINQVINIISRRKLRKKLKTYKSDEYNMIIFAGGQLFMECFIDYIIVIVQWAKENGIPVVFNSCGLGSMKITGIRKLRKALLSHNVKSITLRDRVEQFDSLFPTNLTASRIYDPVVEISQYYKPAINPTVKLGIGIIHPINFRNDCVKIDSDSFDDIIKEVVNICVKQNIDYEFFTNGDLMDEEYCAMLATRLNCRHKVAPRPNSPEELVNTIVKYENIISCRLHSHIIAASYGIPTVAMIWDLKVKDFMSLVDREQYCISLQRVPTAEELERMFALLLSKKIHYDFNKLSLTSDHLKNVLS